MEQTKYPIIVTDQYWLVTNKKTELFLKDWSYDRGELFQMEAGMTSRGSKVIAHKPLGSPLLEGVPVMEVEDGKLNAWDYFLDWEKKNNPFYPNEMRWDRHKAFQVLNSYKARAETHPYSKEDMEKAFEAGRACQDKILHGYYDKSGNRFEEYFQSLSQPKFFYPITEECDYCDGVGTYEGGKLFIESICTGCKGEGTKIKIISVDGKPTVKGRVSGS